jgi:hypothetical protein
VGRKRHDKVWHRRFILPWDLQDNLTFGLHSDNLLTFKAWKFDPRHQEGNLSNVAFFNRELGVSLAND